MQRHSRLTKIGLVSGGLVAGVVLAGTMAAQASTPSPSPTAGSTSTATTADPHPGDNGADGVPESQEHHGGPGRGLDLSGTVTAVGADSVTIKTATSTVTYAVTSTSDIDKNGEAKLSDLAVGDAVTFSADGTTSKTIDKLHAGDEAKNAPAHTTATTTGGTASPNA